MNLYIYIYTYIYIYIVIGCYKQTDTNVTFRGHHLERLIALPPSLGNFALQDGWILDTSCMVHDLVNTDRAVKHTYGFV